MNFKDVLSRVFEITRDPRDGIHFLEEFKSLSPESFALIYADGNTIIESSEALFSDITLLFKLGLYPILVLEEESIAYLKVFFPTENEESTIERKGIGFPYQIINNVDILMSVKASMESFRIPILPWNKDTNSFSNFLSQAISVLNTNKVIVVHHEGPLQEDSGKIISLITTGDKMKIYRGNATLNERDLTFANLAETLVEERNRPKFSVVLTSPYTLLRELFTVKGSGTLIKKENRIYKFNSFEGLDQGRLFNLIETSFSKKLKTNFTKTSFGVLYLEENYQGCAWLNQTPHGFLLSKFAVNEIARGAGVGRDVWDLITAENLPLFWRSKPTNTINKWYMKMAQGIEKDDEWIYYWLGMPTQKIPTIIEYLKLQPEDFEKKQ